MQLNIKIFLINLLSVILFIGCSIKNDSVIAFCLPKIINQFNPSIIWHRSVGYGSRKHFSQLSPAYDENIVYAADRKGIVIAMHANSGKVLWSIDLSQQISTFTGNSSILLSSGLTISGNKIYIGTETGKVIALNKINGEIIWETDVSGEAISYPVVSISNGLVLIHTSNGILEALDIHSGKNKWSINLSNSTLSIRGKSAPTIFYDNAVVGSDNGRVNIVTVDQGQIAWQYNISQIVGATEVSRLHDVNITPIVDINSRTIFAIAYNGDLVSIDMNSNQITWKLNLGSVNDITIIDNIIYLVDQNDRILAINKIDGVILWNQNALLHHNLTPPIIYDGYLVVGDELGYLYWLDIKSGQFVAQNRVDTSGLHSRLIIANNKLLVQARNGTVYLIKR